jgi:NAD(P)-dependent dehydrogenase (short-subunit alcohol dehydrogenase family)
MVIPRAAYSLSKAGGTLFVQLLANQIPIEELQIITFHPGQIYGDGWAASGITKDMLPFDEGEKQYVRVSNTQTDLGIVDLPGAFAVWAASKEAAFLNGRVVWASWDVEELANGDVRNRIDKDGDYLRISVVGFKGVKRA